MVKKIRTVRKLPAVAAGFILLTAKPRNSAALSSKRYNEKRFVNLFFSLFSFLCSLLYLWWHWAASPVCFQNCQNQTFTIDKGEGVGSIANRLEKAGLIHNHLAFRIATLYFKTSTKIQAGDYRLNPQMSLTEIAQQLTHGTLDIWLTIIEGWRREQVAQKLTQGGLVNFDSSPFMEKTVGLEGQLFPDTYLISKTADADEIIKMMTKNFQKKAGLVDNKTLILASLVEREMPHNQDRPVVAGILLKRIKAGWPLQVDATVQYAIATQQYNNIAIKQSSNFNWWPKGLTQIDLKIKSPFNTYLNLGLPPAPICNPGLGTIQAAQNPVSTEYWYYLSDSSGVTHFAKTIEEHNQNIQKYLLK